MSQAPSLQATETRKPWTLWAGRVLSAIPVLLLLASGFMKVSHGPAVVEGFQKYGYSADQVIPIGIVEILCAVLYAIPRTSPLGAALVTAYLGGAVSTHVRAGEPFVAPVALGVLVWLGLYLRDERIRVLAPWATARV